MIIRLIYFIYAYKLLGIMINWLLFGVLSVQICAYSVVKSHPCRTGLLLHSDIYWVSFPKDPRILKLVVCVQFLLETAQTATSTRDLFHHFTGAYASPEDIWDVGNTWIYIPLMLGLSMYIIIF